MHSAAAYGVPLFLNAHILVEAILFHEINGLLQKLFIGRRNVYFFRIKTYGSGKFLL
jgi:hypothetical protein